MIASHDENGASIHLNPAELRDIIRLTGAMNNPNAVHFETQIFIDLFNSIANDREGMEEDVMWRIDSLNKQQLHDTFEAKANTPAKEERPLDV